MGGLLRLLFLMGCDLSLILSMRVGHDFFVGGTRFVVSKAESPFHFILRREDGRLFEITDQRWTFIRNGVQVQAGVPRNPSSRILGVVFKAPKEVKIIRGSLQKKADEVSPSSSFSE